MRGRGAESFVGSVTAEHHVARARQAAEKLARETGFGEPGVCAIATSVSELAGNLFIHAARGGTITLSSCTRDGEAGLEVVAEDKGPGIADVARALEDGFSTNRGLGGGLPGIRRLMDEFHITSTAGMGTRIVARKWKPCGRR